MTQRLGCHNKLWQRNLYPINGGSSPFLPGMAHPSHGQVAMTCNPSQTAKPQAMFDEREQTRQRAEVLLAHHPVPTTGATRVAADTATDAGLATALMDLFRRTAAAEVFECLVRWVAPQLYLRIRSRLRTLGAQPAGAGP
jgi:hypothetical protein